MIDSGILAAVLVTFFLAGAVKGVIGLGLPAVGVGLMTAAFDLTTAMALILVPAFVTNVWQAVAGGGSGAILRRTWPFLLTATATVWIGALALTRINLSLLSALLGTLLIVYALLNMAGIRFSLNPRQAIWAGPLLGAVNGVLTGMTGNFAVPGVLFLQAIGLPRDQLIQAMGMLFTVSTVALAFALQRNDFLTLPLATLSAIAVLPAIGGMLLGQTIRKRLSEQLFRRAFFIGLLALGVYIVGRSALAS